MNRRSLIKGVLAAAGAGVLFASYLWRDGGLLASWRSCKGMPGLRARITSDYQNMRTAATNRWIVAESEAELLAEIARGDAEAAAARICAGS